MNLGLISQILKVSCVPDDVLWGPESTRSIIWKKKILSKKKFKEVIGTRTYKKTELEHLEKYLCQEPGRSETP